MRTAAESTLLAIELLRARTAGLVCYQAVTDRFDVQSLADEMHLADWLLK